jgi:hypothetical protein
MISVGRDFGSAGEIGVDVATLVSVMDGVYDIVVSNRLI